MSGESRNPAGRPAGRDSFFNGYVILSKTAGTAAALLFLICGAAGKSEWCLMLAVYFAGTAFVKSYFLASGKANTSRARQVRGYQKMQTAGVLLAVLQAAALAFTVLKKDSGFDYPFFAMIIVVLLAVWEGWSLFTAGRSGVRETAGAGPEGFRTAKAEEFLTIFLLLVHVLYALISGSDDAGKLWILTAVVFAVLILCSCSMVLKARREIRSRMKGRRASR